MSINELTLEQLKELMARVSAEIGELEGQEAPERDRLLILMGARIGIAHELADWPLRRHLGS